MRDRSTINLLCFSLVCAVFTATLAAHADGKYFNTGIDYWKEDKSSKKGSVEIPVVEEKSKFDWNKHLDPNNKDFFKEGNHTPPEPFMELIRRPTDRNIKLWFAYIEKKNRMMSHLMKNMEAYLFKNGKKLNAQQRELVKKRLSQIPAPPADYKRYRFRAYFDSKCPHCKRMYKTLNQLQQAGYFVEARQIDRAKNVRGLSVPFVYASKEEVKKHRIKSVPVLLVGDMKKEKVFRLTGFQTVESIFSTIRSPSI